MKITQFDDKYNINLGIGGTTLVSSTGSNGGFGGDVEGEWGALSVVGLRQQISLASNQVPVNIGDVLTIVSNGATPVAQFAAASNSLTTQTIVTVTAGAAQTIDFSLGVIWDITLTANCTFTISNPPASGIFGELLLFIRQGGSGSYTVTWPGTVGWDNGSGLTGGAAPTLYTSVGALNVIMVITEDGGATYGGTSGAASGGSSLSFGSNSMSVGATNQAGTSGTYVGSDHRHLGLHSITSSSSNTLQRPVVNFRAGTNIGLAASDTDGDGAFDTITISATGGSGGGGGSGSITASGYTQTTAKMLGRSTASTGAIEEITVGSGLSLSAGTLSASGGSTPSASAYDSAVSALSPAAYWKLDEDASGFTSGAGNYADTVASNTLVVSGSGLGPYSKHGQTGPFGPASGSWFLGSGDSGAATSAIAASDDRTLMAWIRTTSHSDAGQLAIMKENAGGSGKYGSALYLGPHAVANGIRNHLSGGVTGDNFSTAVGAYNGAPLAYTWHHVAVVIDGTASSTYVVGQMKLYLDGVQLTTGSNDTYAGTPRAAPMQAQALQVNGSSGMIGWISRIAIFTTALSGANIASLYAASPHI